VFVVEIAAAKESGQDRVRVIEIDGGLVIALADGAGGTGHGAIAADTIVAAIGSELRTAVGCCELIEHLDTGLDGGQSTAVVLVVRDNIVGASVGDSGAWLIRELEVVDLTHAQQRKPLVGDGCIAVPFEAAFDGVLLVASDGLLRYATRDAIARLVREQGLAAVRALVDLVRLPTGALQDDVSLVLVSASRTWSGTARSTAAPH
jgi:serine/threonine protein phosphatase PrpC